MLLGVFTGIFDSVMKPLRCLAHSKSEHSFYLKPIFILFTHLMQKISRRKFSLTEKSSIRKLTRVNFVVQLFRRVLEKHTRYPRLAFEEHQRLLLLKMFVFESH